MLTYRNGSDFSYYSASFLAGWNIITHIKKQSFCLIINTIRPKTRFENHIFIYLLSIVKKKRILRAYF